MGLAEKTLSGVLWSALGELIVKFISPISFLVLTRLLSPSDFGTVAVATTVLMFVNIISDLGTGKVLVQLKCEDCDFFKYCNVSFYFNVVVGACLFLVVFCFSSEIATYNNQPQANLVVKIMSLQILFYAFSTVQSAIKNRELKFKTLFYIRLITVATPALISIPVAFAGGGMWAIVAGSVAGSMLHTIALWVTSTWKPRWYFKLKYLHAILSKSIWNSLQQILVWIPIALDTYLISNYISGDALGLYTTSRTLFTSVSALILAPVLPVLFSSLSKVKEEDKFIKMTLFSQKALFTVASILSLTVFLYSEFVSSILFDNKWIGISPLIQIVFLLMGMEYFNSLLIESLRAKGRFRELAMTNLLSLFIVCPALYISVFYGIYVYTFVRCMSLYVCFIGVFYYSKEYCGVSFRDCLVNNKCVLLLLLIIVPVSLWVKGNCSEISYYITISLLLIAGLIVVIRFEKEYVLKLLNFIFKRR